MALFGFGKKNKTSEPTKAIAKEAKREVKVEKAPVQVKTATLATEGFSAVLLGTRVTEKASLLSEKSNVYTFNVSSDANKHSVSEAVEKLYKVHPVKVHIVPVTAKRVFVRGKRGVKSGGRKAYVYLPQGEKIEIA
ncbi:MAG TPA: 50S ribosomal protein L23 [Candidatus Paceibacterota bacterium]